MNKPLRDLLVLLKQELMSPQAMEHQVEALHKILPTTEQIQNLVTAHELLDLNKYKIVNNPVQLRDFFKRKTLKPFVFLNCKN
jgi:hypothetical protein